MIFGSVSLFGWT